MEKKQYIMPSVRVKAVKLENQLLAGSGEGEGSITFNEDGTTGSANLNNEGAENDALSKQGFTSHDVWED